MGSLQDTPHLTPEREAEIGQVLLDLKDETAASAIRDLQREVLYLRSKKEECDRMVQRSHETAETAKSLIRGINETAGKSRQETLRELRAWWSPRSEFISMRVAAWFDAILSFGIASEEASQALHAVVYFPYTKAREARAAALEEAAKIVLDGCPDTPEWSDRRLWLFRAATAIREQIKKASPPEQDVHTEHCCAEHGCKYGEEELCSVTSGRKPQSYPCDALDCVGYTDDSDFVEP